MADLSENPPPRVDAPSTRNAIRRVEKRTVPTRKRRDGKRPVQRMEAPGWRHWLSTKLV